MTTLPVRQATQAVPSLHQLLHSNGIVPHSLSHLSGFHLKFFGKPNPEPYRLAEQLLVAQVKLVIVLTNLCPAADKAVYLCGDLLSSDMCPGQAVRLGLIAPPLPSATGSQLPFSGIYAVGDNPRVRDARLRSVPSTSPFVLL